MKIDIHILPLIIIGLLICMSLVAALTALTQAAPSPNQQGCYHEGKYFPLGSYITRNEDRENNRCWGLYCTWHGYVSHWNTEPCFTKTDPQPTTPPSGEPHYHKFILNTCCKPPFLRDLIGLFKDF